MDAHGTAALSVVCRLVAKQLQTIPVCVSVCDCVCGRACVCLSEQLLKAVVVTVVLAGLVPLLLGLLFELVIVAPLRVPLDQTPLFYPWQVGPASGRGRPWTQFSQYRSWAWTMIQICCSAVSNFC